MTPIETKNPLFGSYLYPAAKEIMEKQQDVFWTAVEIPIEKDIHDYRSNMDQYQYKAVTTTLQSFVEIEQKVGEVWDTISTWFPHSEIEGMCSQFASMEKAIHAFFYQKMSDVLNIEPEEVAKNQETITVLKNKLALLTDITQNLGVNKPLTLATVALIEQVLLFSNFALLKSFKSNGYNLIGNTITGVDFVVQDEQLHGVGASFLHNQLVTELGDDLDLGHFSNVHAIANEIIHHEYAIIDYIYEGTTSINDVTVEQLKAFIRARVNHVLTDLGIPGMFEVEPNPIADWFYKGANSIKLHDFFVSGTNSYRRGWSLDKLSRKPFLGKETTHG